MRQRRSSFDPTGDALWSAVGDRDLERAQKLIKAGADVNMVCPDGWVREECRPRKGGVGRSLLHHAAWAGSLAVFKLLVKSGADVNRRRNTAWRPNGGVRGRGSTPLHHAVQYNREPIVLYLLDEVGVDIDMPGEQGYTALHIAAKFKFPKLVELLLLRGARTDMLTRDEKTARELAVPRQERSHWQMGNMAELFDKYDKEAKGREKALPGAPLPPKPMHQQALRHKFQHHLRQSEGSGCASLSRPLLDVEAEASEHQDEPPVESEAGKLKHERLLRERELYGQQHRREPANVNKTRSTQPW